MLFLNHYPLAPMEKTAVLNLVADLQIQPWLHPALIISPAAETFYPPAGFRYLRE